MTYTIYNKQLKGTVHLPPSKSYLHRAILCASLARGRSIISNITYSEDIKATIKAMKSLGTIILENDHYLEIDGTTTFMKNNVEIDCKQSGSTLRFMVPISLIYESQVHFTGEGELGKRPMNIYYDIFEKQGIGYLYRENVLDLYIRGRLRGGIFEIPGDVSSQFISGLLFALPLMDEDSKIIITSPLQSSHYVDMTIEILKHFNISIINHDHKEYIIKGRQFYLPSLYTAEADESQAANFYVANALGNEIELTGTNDNSIQGDRIILDLIEQIKHQDMIIDGSECIDSIPILALLCTQYPHHYTIKNIERLRYKECDRLHATVSILQALGANIKDDGHHLYIEGGTKLKGGSVSSYHDHRMMMMIAIASAVCEGHIEVDDIDCVKKSYPDFFDVFVQLGGKYDVGS